MHSHMCADTHAHSYTNNVHQYTHTRAQEDAHTQTCTFIMHTIPMSKYTHAYTQICMHSYMRTHTLIDSYEQTHIHTNTHACSHTHNVYRYTQADTQLCT